MDVGIRDATRDDLARHQASLRAQAYDNGEDGRWFSTLTAEQAQLRMNAEDLERMRLAHAKPLTEPGWLRVFLAVTPDDTLLGAVEVAGGAVLAELHRCRIGLGLQRAYRGRGLGTALMRHAIAWARGAGLAWMDLGVMVGNAPAIALYRKLGFLERGRTDDRFRIGGTSVGELLMTLALTPSAPGA